MDFVLYCFQLFNGTFKHILKTHNLEALCKRAEHFYTSVSVLYLHKGPIINMQVSSKLHNGLSLCVACEQAHI